MGEAIQYLFVASGNDTVAAAFEGIGAAAQRAADKAEGAAKREERATQKAGAAAQRAADASAKAAERAEAAKAKAAEKWADNRARTEDKWAAASAKAADRQAAAHAKAEQRKVSEAEKSAKRRAKVEADLAQKNLDAIVKSGRKTADQLTSAASSAVRTALGLAAAGAAAVGAVLGKASGEANATQGLANRIAINGGRGAQATSIRHELEATAVAHAGHTAEGLAGGVSAYQESRGGDRGKALDEARKFGDVIATVSSATGRGADEVGKAAALISKTQGAKSVKEMGDALAQLVGHARETGVPLSEAIGHLDKMGAAAKRFGIKDQSQLGALQRLGAEGAGAQQGDKVAEAFLRKVSSDKTARTLKAAGADPYADKNGTLKSPRELLEGLYSKVGTSKSASDKISTISKMVGPQGAKMLAPLNQAFASAYGATQGSDSEKVKSGVDAMLAAFDQAATETGNYASMQTDAAQAEQANGAQMTAAWEKIKAVVGEELAPTLAAFAKDLANDPGAITAFIDAVKLAVTGLEAFVSMMRQLGLIKDITNSPEAAEAEIEKQEKILVKHTLAGTLDSPEAKAAEERKGEAYEFLKDQKILAREARHRNGEPEPGASPGGGGGGGEGSAPSEGPSGDGFKAKVEEAAEAFLAKLRTGAGSIFGTPRQTVDGS